MEARKKDIIFVYEIIDHYDFLNIIRNIRYTQPTDYEEYMGRSCVKLIYERIDGVMETD